MNEIWDLHSHLSYVPGDTPGDRLARLIEFADRMGVARLCLYMGMEWSNEPTPEKMRQENDEAMRAVSRFPDRAFGFAYLNPQHPQACLDELKRCVRDGPMVGVKLWVAHKCSAPELDPIVQLAAQLKAPVFQHTWIKVDGNLPGESTPMDIAELARRHPEATLICGHSGGDWEQGLRAIRPYENVHTDLGGGDPAAGFTEMAVRELGAGRVLYGSDVGGRSFASQLAKVYGADLDDAAREMILGGNLRRILKPILDKKEIKI